MRPLEGIRIIDLTTVISGPMATCYLADQGADVIKIESPEGDISRYLGPRRGLQSAMFITANRNKRSVCVDLKSEAGRQVALDLIPGADVFVHNYRPGVAERLGLGYEAARALNDSLVYCAISGFGPTGPRADQRAYDPVIQAASGVAATQKDPRSGEAALIQSLVCDKLTALTAAQSITAALFQRLRTKRGVKLDLAMLDAALAFMWPEGMYNHTLVDDDGRPSPDFGDFYQLLRGKDCQVAYAGVKQSEFEGLCRALELEDMIADPRFASPAERMRNAVDLQVRINEALAKLPREEIIARALAEDAPMSPVNRPADLPTDPQIVHNAALYESEDPLNGKTRTPRHPSVFDEAPFRQVRPAPGLGEHTEEILAELGRSPDEIAKLTQADPNA